MQRLLERRDALAAGLPAFAEIVRGSLVTRYRRCGKPTCHCATTRGHGPAHYRVVTLKPGTTEQILLSKAMLPGARQFLANYARWWAALEQVSAVNRRLLRRRVAAVAGPGQSPNTQAS
ncbi:MAG TPA: DUF6788 family protein [bacterium]|nr:DUF6788 family protein [bacterium]